MLVHSRIERELQYARSRKERFSHLSKAGVEARKSKPSDNSTVNSTVNHTVNGKLNPSPSPSPTHIKTTTEAGGGLSKEFFERHDEYHFIANCEPLSKITIERYAQIKREYPNIKDFKKTIREICLKAKDPETIIKKPDGWLISNLSYASQRDESAPTAKTEWDKIMKRGCIVC
jgi:hypothetical protein